MEITSIPFVLLVIASVIVYYLLNHKFRIWYLTILSCFFVASLSSHLLFYIAFYTLVNYWIGINLPVTKYKKLLYRTGLFFNLLQLFLLKYSSFAINPVFQELNIHINVTKLSEIIVPLGISYFTLQGIGYLTNIKMGWEKPEKQFPSFLLYIIFYPKFLSGPIERSNHFLPQLKEFKAFSSQQVTEGFRIALLGFFKKVVIANQLGLIVSGAYSNLSSTSGLSLWMVILIQPLYLYFDFSGYTDIALGFAKIYGINLLPNFDKPFLSENVTNFWKRFHMSLSLWFNDYVFKQLSFKYRKWGKLSPVFAVFVTFTLFGIWHGAGWNFMVLGFLQALAINYEFFTKRKRLEVFSKMPDALKKWTGRFFTYIFYGFSLVFFFAPDLNTALNFFSELKDYNDPANINMFSKLFYLALIASIIFLANEVLSSDSKLSHHKVERFWNSHKLLRFVIYNIIIFLIITQLSGGVSFIYQMF